MQRDRVHVPVTLLEDLPIPIQVGGHAGATRAAGHEHEVAVHHPHLPGRVCRLPPVLRGRHVPDLPGTVHLVAQAPALHAVRCVHAVLAAQVAPPRSPLEVAVLDEGRRHLGRPRPEVDREERLRPRRAAPGHELVGPELVGLQALPGPFQHARPRLLRAHAVHPVVAGDEVAAGIADDGHSELVHLLEHVLAEAVTVGQLRAGVVDPPVDGAPQVLQEGAQDTPVEGGHPANGVQDDARGLRGLGGGHAREPGVGPQGKSGRSSLAQETAARGGHGISFFEVVWILARSVHDRALKLDPMAARP